MKNILFISINRHQSGYFHYIGKSMTNEYNVTYLDFKLSNLIGLLNCPKLPAPLGFTQAELDRMIEFMAVKGQYREFSGWREYLHSRSFLLRQAHAAIDFFYKFILERSIDLLCVWNGTLVPLAAAAGVAQKLGRKTLFFENGYLPNTTVVDPLGVNFKSSLTSLQTQDLEHVQMEPWKLAQLYQEKPAIRALKNRWYHRFFPRKPVGEPEVVSLPERYLFVPFQVHDDTQVLLNSPAIKTMSELTDCVAAAVADYIARTGDRLAIVFKEHPSDFGRVDYRHLKNKYAANRQVYFLRFYPTPKLIEKALGIITINSSVGMEALLSHKPVITLGNAFYNVEGMVKHVGKPVELVAALPFLFQPVNHVLMDRFLYFLRYIYLADGSWRQPDARHIASVRTKVAAVFTED